MNIHECKKSSGDWLDFSVGNVLVTYKPDDLSKIPGLQIEMEGERKQMTP